MKRLERTVTISLIPVPGIILITSAFENYLDSDTHIKRIDIPV